MKKNFKLLWEKLNEPPVERLLIVLLPFLSILLAAFIIAPGVLDNERQPAARALSGCGGIPLPGACASGGAAPVKPGGRTLCRA